MQPHAVTLITGAAAGIGLAFATALANRGENLILVDIAADRLHRLADELAERHHVKVHEFAIDLSDHDAAERIFQFCRAGGLEVSTLINNAGIGEKIALAEQSAGRIDKMIGVNVGAVVRLTRAFLPSMLERRRGTIVNVSSSGAFHPMPKWALYAGTKSFIVHFTTSLQEELAETGVYVALVCPGVTRTDFFASAGVPQSEIPPDEQTSEQVVEEALAGLARRKAMIATGRSNRRRIWAQQMSLRTLFRSLHSGLRLLRIK